MSGILKIIPIICTAIIHSELCKLYDLQESQAIFINIISIRILVQFNLHFSGSLINWSIDLD